ncbi:hypothetical protein V2G26_020510 [Clonostachys chloroleuca]
MLLKALGLDFNNTSTNTKLKIPPKSWDCSTQRDLAIATLEPVSMLAGEASTVVLGGFHWAGLAASGTRGREDGGEFDE